MVLPGRQEFDRFGTPSRNSLPFDAKAHEYGSHNGRTRKPVSYRYQPYAYLAGPRLLRFQPPACPAKGCLIIPERRDQQSQCRRTG